MKLITVNRLPPVAMANIIGLFRIAVLIVDVSFKKVYLRAFTEIRSTASFTVSHLIVQYLVPIASAWIIGLLFAIGYNAIVKSIGRGLRVEIEE